MEMLLYQSTQFRDVKKILDRAHGFAGLLTAGGIEASRLDVPFVCDQKVLSRYDDACSDVRRILTMQLGLTLPKGFSIPLEAEDLAVFFSQQCGLQQMQDYLTQKRARTQADIQTWLRDRPWDTHPVTAAQAADDLMNVTGVKASFVCCKVDDVVYVSARSFGDVNVQRIMEKLGGGGNATTAGAQFPGKTTEDVLPLLKETIDNYFDDEA